MPLRCLEGAGVDHAIVVHPEPYQDDHRYLEHCLAVGRGKLKGTCLFFADQPGSLERMAALVKAHEGQIVTARIHAYGVSGPRVRLLAPKGRNKTAQGNALGNGPGAS